jgi:DNA-binding IclR family transcriptional regulator
MIIGSASKNLAQNLRSSGVENANSNKGNMEVKLAAKKNIRRRKPKFFETTRIGETKGGVGRYLSRTIERALDVLEVFSESSNLSLREISESTKQAESTAFRVLLTLQSRGYLQQNEDGTYHLAPKVLLGKDRERAERLRELVHPRLELLVRKFNETASMAYLFDIHIQVIDSVESMHDVHVRNKIGRVIAPYASSLGKAITAFQDSKVIDTLLEIHGLFPRTKNTIVDRRAVYAEFDQIHKTGHAFDREETSEGAICTAVPIFSPSGRVDAAISISVPQIRMNDELQADILASLVKVAREVQDLTKEA